MIVWELGRSFIFPHWGNMVRRKLWDKFSEWIPNDRELKRNIPRTGVLKWGCSAWSYWFIWNGCTNCVWGLAMEMPLRCLNALSAKYPSTPMRYKSRRPLGHLWLWMMTLVPCGISIARTSPLRRSGGYSEICVLPAVTCEAVRRWP